MIEYSYDPPYNLWSGNRSDTLNKWKINYKGSIATASALPEKGDFKGDTYNVLEDGSNYMWNGSSWDKLDANAYVGATSTANGIQGLVPPATSAERGKFLKGDATWDDVAWDMITGKPLTFTPSSHTHSISDITDIIQDRTVYLDANNGSDTNDGLTATTAWQTFAHAKEVIGSGHTKDVIVINVAAGTYNEIFGAIDSINTITFNFADGAKLQGLGTQLPGKYISIIGGTVELSSKIYLFAQSFLALQGGTTIEFKNLDEATSIQLSNCAVLNCKNVDATHKIKIKYTNCSFSQSTVYVGSGSVFACSSYLEFEGSPSSGAPYKVLNNGIITSAGSETYFPGVGNGVVTTGGIYN